VPEEPARPTSRSVLVVEDEAPLRAILCEELEHAGYRVLEANSAQEALEIGASGVDLLVTDTLMPKLDGPELVKRFREEKPALPVLFISGSGPLVEFGSDSRVMLLNKPFRRQVFLDAVKRLLAL
jgi:two-component system, cell cycle sensor histidine kinase and response regulator CckA